ncbi:MAG: hypothetical protein CMP36_01440 [Rickettsiales bacterium]|jgi:hypothetical protein|nr:hypothetical protein [Rickettsiales bacterium]OUV75669.1 MAG: hypothetical protein CBC91_07115 [Rickettsiales bacterium TMED131]OUV81957.1 MAG: hypothetical protein CBC91_01940 [Rickettsiales bacterium TMED131]|tara:strand:+ start:20747 stop:20941 length:195 start_codon:yes stop_codon:yes gene_type:complete
MIEVIWTLILTACMNDSSCHFQEVKEFKTKNACIELKEEILSIPADGPWKTIDYNCLPKGGMEA